MDTSFEEMMCLRYVVLVDTKLIPLNSSEEDNERKQSKRVLPSIVQNTQRK